MSLVSAATPLSNAALESPDQSPQHFHDTTKTAEQLHRQMSFQRTIGPHTEPRERYYPPR